MATQIPPDAWERAGGRYIATAFELLNEQAKAAAGADGDPDVVMSG